MKSETIEVQQLFEDRRQYLVPVYQRKYVWDKEDQWERLWWDIVERADIRLIGGTPTPHFLGASVLEPQTKTGLLGVETLHIIDGQQRLTTLQYVLAALAMSLREESQAALLSLVERCLTNSNIETMERPEEEVLKVWPTFPDRSSYKATMSAVGVDDLRERFPAHYNQNGTLKKIGIDHPKSLEAIWYFKDQIYQWLKQDDDDDETSRLTALTGSILRDLRMVTISLGEDDDAQVIFETLNGQGAKLHATDLIRNFVFMRAEQEKHDASSLYDAYWTPFETNDWMEEQRRGRLKRPRLDWFIQTTLQAYLGDEVDISRLYVGYKRFAMGNGPIVRAEDQLRLLNEYGEHYLDLVKPRNTTPIGRFGRRILAWDASTTHSLALLIATSDCDEAEQNEMFDDLASYFVRRAICGLTTKNYNKVFVQQLKQLAGGELSLERLRASLTKLEGDASRWPSDDEFRKSWFDASMFPGRLDSARTKAVLIELEEVMRPERAEERQVRGVDELDVDHILPTGWFTHWPLSDGSHATTGESEEVVRTAFSDVPMSPRQMEIHRRDSAKSRIGNLTLLHYGSNRALQNYGLDKKREELFANSTLHLNRKLMRAERWDEQEIDGRGRELFEHAKQIWRGPTN